MRTDHTIGSHRRIYPSLNRLFGLFALTASAFVGSCSEPHQQPAPAPLDAGVPETGLSVIAAGTIGTCIPIEPVQGYRTCLMSTAPARRTASQATTRS